MRAFLWYWSVWKKHELSWSTRCFVYTILSFKIFPLYVGTWCHIDETLGWIIFFLFVQIFMIYWNSWRSIPFKVQREETEKQETRAVNKSKNQDLHRPLWGHSLLGAQAEGTYYEEKGTLPNDSNPMPEHVTLLSEHWWGFSLHSSLSSRLLCSVLTMQQYLVALESHQRE